METKQLLSEGDIMHIRMLLREEKDNGYAATVIKRLNATEEALKNSAQLVDCRLIWAAAELAKHWPEERETFADYARPHWQKWGGADLVNHMTSKYIHNDKSIVEYMYNLDTRNKLLVVKYLLQCKHDYDPMNWMVDLKEE